MIENADRITIEAWVNTLSWPTRAVVCRKEGSYILYNYSGGFSWYLFGPENRLQYDIAGTLGNGAWGYIVGTYDKDAGPVRFVHFGKLRLYKGTTDLVQAFARTIAPHATLTVTGQSFLPEPLTVPEHVAARITLDERKLSEEELARTVADADFAVLPYRRILNSGSLLLAFSLGVPAVVPDLPAMRELVADGENGFLYAANKIDALAAALARAAATSTEEREAMRIAARASAERLAWSNLADRLRALFDNAPLEDLAA